MRARTRRQPTALLAIATWLWLVPAAVAQEGLEPERDREETAHAEAEREPLEEPSAESDAEPAAPQRFFAAASLGFDFSHGDYGEPKSTDFLAISAALKLEYEPITFRVSVPFLYKDGVEDVIPGVGSSGDSASTGEEAGIGNMITSLAYTWYPTRDYVPIVDLITKVKIPTASKSRGLGTGRADVTLQMELTEVLGPVALFGGVGYRFKGGGRFDDVIVAGGGVGYRFARSFSAGVAYDFREAATSSASNVNEIVPYLSIRVGRARLGPYSVFGLTNGSPDWGVGTNLTVEIR